jgi:SPP1 gp7 family putative phage head morphogenesis protein
MASRDLETLLTQGASAVSNHNAVIDREMAAAYLDAYNQANNELAKLYAKLGADISLPEAQKYARLPQLMKSLAAEYKKLTGYNIKVTQDLLAYNYTESYYRYQWSMEQAIGTPLPWGVLPIDAIRASVFSEDLGLTFIKTLQDNSVANFSRIQATITRGIAAGQSYAKTAKQMRDMFNRGLSDAFRVTQNESGRAFTEGFQKAHNDAVDMGIQVDKKWLATLDGRTRPDHGRADGQIADADGNFHVGGAKGIGPHRLDAVGQNMRCRCIAVDVLRNFPPQYRRDGKDIIPYTTYAEWEKSKAKKTI